MGWKEDADFVGALGALLKDEGGFQREYFDRGNWTSGQVGKGQLKGTKYGISAASYPSLDIEGLTADQAGEIYYRDWWQGHGLQRLRGDIRAKMLNLSVWDGPARASILLQRAIRACGAATIRDNGLIDAATLAAVNSYGNAEALRCALRSEAAGYIRMVNQTRVFQHLPDVGFEGWLRRAYE